MREKEEGLFGAGEAAIGVFSLISLYILSQYSYPAFHTFAELFSIVIGFSLFMLIWNSRRIIDNNYLVLIGIAYFFVAGIDLIHTLSYKGMDLFPGYGVNLPTQLWIAARYMESLSLFAAPFLLHRKLYTGWTLAGYTAVTLVLLISIFKGFFPDCYVEGTGLTGFKISSEYLISVILSCSLILLLRRRIEFDRDVFILLVASIILTMGSELSFTFYIDVYGISNLIGHYLKIISFYLVYKAIIETGFSKPYKLMFRNLKKQEKALQERTKQLEATNRELESFSYSVSHDLRAPLRAIDAFSRKLLKDMGNKLNENEKRKFNIIVDNARRMGQIIDDLLALSQLGRQAMSSSAVDMSELVRQVWEECYEPNAYRKIELKMGDLPQAIGDRGLLKQVVANLISNAVKFTKFRKDAIIEIAGSEQGNENIYYVKDNGAGFNMEYYDKLFGVFQRLHNAAEFEGTGIGLSIVSRIINRHGGRIWAEGKENEGAVFYFTIPARNREAA